MKLVITTPFASVVEAHDVVALRAEDRSGAFGILRGHADFVTVLAVSVVTWRDAAGIERHAAVRGGMLEVRGGDEIRIATREAVSGEDLDELEHEVLARFRSRFADEQASRADADRLHVSAVRQIVRFLRPRRRPSQPTRREVGSAES